jgi:c-di-GMP-binding flagellar brake protein YcgR
MQDRVPLWRIRSHPPEVRQRREYVRVPVRLTVSSAFAQLTIVDLSEGGMSCETPPGLALRAGRELDLTLDLDGDRVEVVAEVVRARPTGSGMVEAALRFRDVSDADATRIRRYVFAAQVRDRAGDDR